MKGLKFDIEPCNSLYGDMTYYKVPVFFSVVVNWNFKVESIRRFPYNVPDDSDVTILVFFIDAVLIEVRVGKTYSLASQVY